MAERVNWVKSSLAGLALASLRRFAPATRTLRVRAAFMAAARRFLVSAAFTPALSTAPRLVSSERIYRFLLLHDVIQLLDVVTGS